MTERQRRHFIPSHIGRNSGWSKRTSACEQWYQCPACGLEAESLTIAESGGWICYRCGLEHRLEALRTLDKAVEVLKCQECGNEVAAAPRNLYSNWGYICSKCNNTVAITFEETLLQPKVVFSVDWNSEIEKWSRNVSAELRIGEVKTDKDLLVVHVMQSLAREEGEPFRSARLDEFGCILASHAERRVFLGYTMWSDDETEATLRQVYIVPEERRKGFAAQLLTRWVHEYADRIGKRFAVESPNEKSVALLVKLGYASLAPGRNVESKCFFVGGL